MTDTAGRVCDGCGAAAAPLTLWRRYEQVRARRGGSAGPDRAVGRVDSRRHSPRYEMRATELHLCPACHADAMAEEDAQGRSVRRATLILAAVAAAVGLISLFGPPFWPVVAGWFTAKSAMDAAAERSAATPLSPYKPPNLVPLNQSGGP